MTDPPAAPIGLAALPEPLRARIAAELEPGERLLWAAEAMPSPAAAILNPLKPGLIGLVSLMVSLGLFWYTLHPPRSARAVDSGNSAGLGVFLLIVSLLSFMVTLVSWSMRRNNRRSANRELYALTANRAIIWQPGKRADGVEVYTIEPSIVRSVHRLEYPDGSGEIRLGYKHAEGEVGPWLPHRLTGIGDVRWVERETRGVLIGPGGPAPTLDRSSRPDPDYEEPF